MIESERVWQIVLVLSRRQKQKDRKKSLVWSNWRSQSLEWGRPSLRRDSKPRLTIWWCRLEFVQTDARIRLSVTPCTWAGSCSLSYSCINKMFVRVWTIIASSTKCTILGKKPLLFGYPGFQIDWPITITNNTPFSNILLLYNPSIRSEILKYIQIYFSAVRWKIFPKGHQILINIATFNGARPRCTPNYVESRNCEQKRIKFTSVCWK